MRFRGITKLSVDAKGRLAMPKNHRDKLEKDGISELVVTADTTPGCLLIYPLPVFEEVEQHLTQMPNLTKRARAAQRRFIGYASDVEMDATGRIPLSAELRDYSGISRKAYLIGQGKKFELWEEAAWEQECAKWKLESEDDETSDETPSELLNISF